MVIQSYVPYDVSLSRKKTAETKYDIMEGAEINKTSKSIGK